MSDSQGTDFIVQQDAIVRSIARIEANIAEVIKGKPEIIRLVVTCLLAEGHLLIEDVPGLGKTTIARALSASISGTWRRIEFTPDLLPSDVTGVTVFNQANRQFEFHPGAVFANVVVADEINRFAKDAVGSTGSYGRASSDD